MERVTAGVDQLDHAVKTAEDVRALAGNARNGISAEVKENPSRMRVDCTATGCGRTRNSVRGAADFTSWTGYHRYQSALPQLRR